MKYLVVLCIFTVFAKGTENKDNTNNIYFVLAS